MTHKQRGWTAVLNDGGSIVYSDIFGPTAEDVRQMLEFIRQRSALDVRPERWSPKNAHVVPCEITIEVPDDLLHPH